VLITSRKKVVVVVTVVVSGVGVVAIAVPPVGTENKRIASPAPGVLTVKVIEFTAATH
jgi:hypothetical protein